MKPVLTVTVNPAVDVATAVDRLEPGRKLRCSEPRYDPGGGGINVSRMIRELGGESTAFVMGGGPTGRQLREMLAGTGMEVSWLEAEGDTRLSMNVTERASGEHYRFVLAGARQPAEKAEEALVALESLIDRQGTAYVVASGSLPPGFPENFFGRVATLAQRYDARLILDTSGPALQAALETGVWLVRPDRHEARELAGTADHDPHKLARQLVERGAAEVVIITRGPDGAVMAHRDGELTVPGQEVEVVSTVGAGDSFVGALTYALASGWPLDDACRYGVAAAAAAVTTEATALAYRHDVERLYAALEDTS